MLAQLNTECGLTGVGGTGYPHLSHPQLPLLVQTVDESSRQTDVISHHRFVVSQTVDTAHTSTQVSVHHRRELTVSKLRMRSSTGKRGRWRRGEERGLSLMSASQ